MSLQFGHTERFPVLRMSDLRAREAGIREFTGYPTFTATGRNEAGDYAHALVWGPDADTLIQLDRLATDPPKKKKREELFQRLRKLRTSLESTDASLDMGPFRRYLGKLVIRMADHPRTVRVQKTIQEILAEAKAHAVMEKITGLNHPFKALGNPPKPAPKP